MLSRQIVCKISNAEIEGIPALQPVLFGNTTEDEVEQVKVMAVARLSGDKVGYHVCGLSAAASTMQANKHKTTRQPFTSLAILVCIVAIGEGWAFPGAQSQGRGFRPSQSSTCSLFDRDDGQMISLADDGGQGSRGRRKIEGQDTVRIGYFEGIHRCAFEHDSFLLLCLSPSGILIL